MRLIVGKRFVDTRPWVNVYVHWTNVHQGVGLLYLDGEPLQEWVDWTKVHQDLELLNLANQDLELLNLANQDLELLNLANRIVRTVHVSTKFACFFFPCQHFLMKQKVSIS
jgi:hypothetical protein